MSSDITIRPPGIRELCFVAAAGVAVAGTGGLVSPIIIAALAITGACAVDSQLDKRRAEKAKAADRAKAAHLKAEAVKLRAEAANVLAEAKLKRLCAPLPVTPPLVALAAPAKPKRKPKITKAKASAEAMVSANHLVLEAFLAGADRQIISIDNAQFEELPLGDWTVTVTRVE